MSGQIFHRTPEESECERERARARERERERERERGERERDKACSSKREPFLTAKVRG